MLCQKCGAELEEGALVCNVCNEILGSSSMDNMMESLEMDNLDFSESTLTSEMDSILFSESTLFSNSTDDLETEKTKIETVQSTLEEEVPVVNPTQEMPVEETPIVSPVEAMPMEEEPVVNPTQEMPVEETPIVSPVEAMPMEEETVVNPTQEMPVEETPIVSPVEAMPMEEEPVVNPTQEMPVEETPIVSPVEAMLDTEVSGLKEESKKTMKTKEKKEKKVDKENNKNLVMVDKRVLLGVGAAIVAAAAAIIIVMNNNYTKKIDELNTALVTAQNEAAAKINETVAENPTTEDATTGAEGTTGSENVGGDTTGEDTTGGEATGNDTGDNKGLGDISDKEVSAVIEKENMDTDNTNCVSIESCINAALADEAVYMEVGQNGKSTGVVVAMAFAQNGTMVMKTTPRCIKLENELKMTLEGLEAPKQTGKRFYIGEIETKVSYQDGAPIMEVGQIAVYTSATNVAKVTKFTQQ